jgi:hypothetical protein
MRQTSAALALFSLLSASVADARESTLAMTCAQANALVAQRGAVVLSTGRYTYNRFVARRGSCNLGEYGVSGWAPARDGRCRIGFVCRPGSNLDRFD